jgi:peroxiredoxin
MEPALTHHPAPDFALPDLQGNLRALKDYRGQIVILNFWSAECPWSECTDRELNAALPEWEAALRENTPRVVLLSIAANANESLDFITQTAAKRGLPFILHDAVGQVANLYGAQTTPHLFVIDPAGSLRYQGAPNDITFRQRTVTRHYLKDAVDALLRGDSPDPCETPAYGCTIVSFAE